MIIIVPIILGLIFLPPLIRGFTDKYAGWFSSPKSSQPNSSSFEEFLKLLPVSPDQKEQLKALLK
ncbi:MAG: hypothetical protein A2754_00205 [Candidatus Magasanikbacteria bacterium RIFCSPHIGHO2_01_FULL_47_8]|uniref:Uncharacterized protein n=1 Tax=Candidatus Magasanikbacteria bacterium RIFCSPHIGHO2_01_FULL_47_8 TaxID=1798673 RepID=A0A1F6MCB6_9BACT|nr:MAG: hypothetical protein A2754_00205 [Candidatus Magasanikbacteria bacterium RIFCSPHIGHO2_01_FULL_47_8]